MPIYNHIPRIEPDMEGATANSNGKAGLVPAPGKGDTNRALMADGTWRIPPRAEDSEKLSGCSIYDPVDRINTDAQYVGIPVIYRERLSGTDKIDLTQVRIVEPKEDGIPESLFGGIQIEYDEDNLPVFVVRAFSNNKYNAAKMRLFGRDVEIKSGSKVKISKSSISGDENVIVELIGDMSVSGTLDVTRIDAGTEYLQLFGKNSGVLLANIVRTGSADAGPYFAPITAENTRLGHGNAKWSAVYATSPEIVTSDKNLKKNISSFTEAYEKLFFDLEPSIFKFKDGESNRTHSGFISQDVEEALKRNGLSALDFAAFCKDQKTEIVVDEEGKEAEKVIEREYIYSLRYEEFIALNTHMLQKLYAKVNEMQEEINRLKGEM